MTVKERNQLIREFEKDVNQNYSHPLDEKEWLQWVQRLEKTDFKKSLKASSNMCWSLVYLIQYIIRSNSEIDLEVLKIAAHLLIKYAQQEHKEYAISEWYCFRNPVLQSIIYKQKWIKPSETISPLIYNDEGVAYPTYRGEDTASLLLALKFNDLDWLEKFFANTTNNFEDVISTITWAAIQDRDDDIREAALAFCHSLDEPRKLLAHERMAIDINEPRALEWLLTYKDYLPNYTRAKVILALLTGKYSYRVRSETEEVVDTLIEIVEHNQYSDRKLPEKAKEVLLRLKTGAGRNLLCTKVVELILNNGKYKELESIALQAGYEPLYPTDKALFFFLTRQFDKYDALDFDRRLMRQIHENANNALRHQIGRIVRSSGRTDYLEILHKGQQEVSNKLAYDEQKTTIRILRSNGRWDAIWQKLFELPFWGGVNALGVLQKTNWQPDTDYERELLARLSSLLRAGLPTSQPFNTIFPAGVLRAQVKVAGRVNAISFAPDGVRLAIATGNRKILIWNLVTRTVEQILSGFEASVGLVAYMPEGTLIWTERSNRVDYEAGVWLWDGREKRRLGNVAGVVNRLQPLNGGEFMVLPLNEQPQIWSIVTGRTVDTAQNFVIPATPDKTAFGGKWRLNYSAAERHITFNNPERASLNSTLKLAGEKITALEVSPTGDVLAAVTEPTGFQVWDLRPLELLELLDQPFGAADTRYMAAVKLVQDMPDISPPARNALAYIETILRHRFRYAIEVDFAPSLQPGAADIELEILDA